MAPAPSRAPENARQSAARAPAPEWPLAPAPGAECHEERLLQSMARVIGTRTEIGNKLLQE